MKRTDRTSGPGRNLPAISHVLRYCSCWHRRSLSASSPIVSTLVLATLILVGCNADTTPTEPAASRVEPAPVADPLAWLDAPQPEQRISTTLEELPASFPAGSPLKLHVASLKRVDIPLSTPLDIPAEPKTIGEALADSLNQVGAEMVLHNNRLMIMAAREAQYALTTRIYDLSSVDTDRQTALAEAVYGAVTGANWLSVDGLGGTAELDPESSTLTVTQSFRAQEQIRRFLSREIGEPVSFQPATNPEQ